MLSGIFFFSERADMLLGRFYRPDIHKVATDTFREKVLLPRKFIEPVIVQSLLSLYFMFNTLYTLNILF